MTTAELVLIAATVIKLSWLLSGPIVGGGGGGCDQPQVPPAHFPASYNLFEGDPF